MTRIDLRETAPAQAPGTGTQDAKHPITPAAGPYGHPFHPILVTVPIGAWVMSGVFDVVRLLGGDGEVWASGAFWLIVGGIVGALAAAVFGMMDLLTIPRRTKAFATGITHMALNSTSIVLFAISAALRTGRLEEGEVSTVAVILSFVALAVLGMSGWLGGKLSYTYGVRVVDQAKQAEGFAAK